MSASRLDWLPPHEDFRAALRATTGSTDPRDRLDRLLGLAGYRLGMLEVLQLDRALGSQPEETGKLVRLRLGLIGSATLKHLVPGIRIAGVRHGFLFDVHVGEYGQFRAESLDPGSTLHRFRPDLVLVSLTAQDLLGSVSPSADASEVEAVLDRSLSELRSLWRALAGTHASAVIQQTLLDTAPPLFGNLDRRVRASRQHMVAVLNDRLSAAADEDGVTVLDLAARAQRDGLDAWFDIRYWLQAKQEIAAEAAPMYGELVARTVAAQRGRSRKCLVLDLDNTLWGGVVGDVGVEGLVLGAGSAAGEAHRALQQYAKQLAARGVVLAVCSKNELTVAEAAFTQHPEMVLERGDIAAFVANWDDKALNLQNIAASLNLGLDSLVFVDDNPAERARVRQALPMVAVPELPEDPAYYVATLAAAGYFEAGSFTREDRDRAAFYARDAERKQMQAASGSLDDFLAGLEMQMSYGPFARNDLVRVSQLFNKTNQFNATGRRYSVEEVTRIAADPNLVTLQFRLLDRLGDNGIVSTMILSPESADSEVFEIENWVMSCRVFGRELEDAALNVAVEALRQRGVSSLLATRIASERNGVIQDLFSRLGFMPVEAGSDELRSRWHLDLEAYQARSTHIASILSP